MGSKMDSFSAEDYFHKVDNMVLSSTQVLRKLFQSRWKETTGKDWEHTEEKGKLLLESQIGEKVKKNCKPQQREKIGKGCLDEWDVSLLSLVLRNFGEENAYKIENEALREIAQLRNKQEHHTSLKYSRKEYRSKVDIFRAALKTLHVEESEIDKLIEKAGLTSSVTTLKLAKKLLKKGEKHVNADEFEKAIPFFNEATTMPSLLPVPQGTMYEKRAECYLKWANYLKNKQKPDDGDKCVEQAMIDATLALEINDSSWNAHFIIGQCHRWNNCYEQGIYHYNRALALSPVQKQVRNELDSCKVMLGMRHRYDAVDPRNAPLTLGELAAAVKERIGLKWIENEEQFLHLATASQRMCRGQNHVFQGHKFRNGLLVLQNDKEAARCYGKAAKVGNVEGIYNLGTCYARGTGVKQNLEKAYALYQQAANSDISGHAVAVGQAQHALGLWYQNSILVEQDYVEVVKWYKKAIKNGSGQAANNLGLMYAEGEGVPRNEKKAEVYWTQAVDFKDPNAAASLMYYFIEHLEPEKARAMFQTGIDLGSIELTGISEDEFNALLLKRLAEFPDLKIMEKYVNEHEKKHKLDTKGLTFYERLQRSILDKDSPIEMLMRNLEQRDSNDRLGEKLNSLTSSDLEIIETKAKEGSTTAQSVLKTLYTARELSRFILENELESGNHENHNHALELLYACCTSEFVVTKSCLYNPPVKTKLKKLVRQLFENKCGENDMKIRFCYACYNSDLAERSQQSLMIEVLKEGVKRYPDNVHYFDLLSSLYELVGDPKSGLECCIKGLGKHSDNVNLLYWKAVHLHKLLEMDTEIQRNCTKRKKSNRSSVAAYMDFLHKAPPDDCRAPAAFYGLTAIYMDDAAHGKVSGRRQVERYFNLGKESEENLLPCYLPLVKSGFQLAVESFLSLVTNWQSPDAPKGILERKQYLESPVRTQLVLQHRRKLADRKMWQSETFFIPFKLTQAPPARTAVLKPITLKEMNPTSSDKVFEDRVIDLTIIEDPFFYSTSILLIAEDENGDVTRLFIYNVEQNKEAEMNLAHGSTIAIMNPYMITGTMDGTNVIRNDEPRCLLYLDKVEKMCRFCGEENAERKCTKCKKAYCSRECQELDWKLFKHKLICSI